MPVCATFRYPRVDLSAKGAGASSSCGTAGNSKLKVIGTGFTPQPFTALRIQRFPNGLDLSPATGPVDYTAQIDGIVTGWPHVAKAIAIPGAAGADGIGFYIMFGQKP